MGRAVKARSGPLLALSLLALGLSACDGDTGSDGSTPLESTTADRTGAASSSPMRSYAADTFPEGTIPDGLATDGRFTTILRILDLHDSALLSFLTISHETGTFFAPTDEAFADLPSGTIEALLEITNNPAARAVIGNHVLPYVLRSRGFETGPLPMGDDGEPVLPVTVQDGSVTIDGAEVIDKEAVNGIVYVVDGVLGSMGSSSRGPPRPGGVVTALTSINLRR
jgi:uncharacterized surface protein with fasciclin (FAS1) repeats